MTLYVTSAVIIVSAVAMLAIALRVRKDYEALLQDRISDDLAAITLTMEQKMLRVEDATAIISSAASRRLDDRQFLDSLLCGSVASLDEIKGVSLIFSKGSVKGVDGYYERYAFRDGDGTIRLNTYINGDELESDDDWRRCYKEGNSTWGKVSMDYLTDEDEICFFVPIIAEDGRRAGMAYSSLHVASLTPFVTKYKVRSDIDISVYLEDGTMLVAPDNYILDLSPTDMIVRDSTIDHLGWKVVLSADRRIIGKKVREALLLMFLLIVLMYALIYIVIRYTVRYVAKPFIERQRRVENEKAVMENEMLLASGAQKELLPHSCPAFPDRKGIELSACLYPARKVGGDLYDYFINGNKLFFCIGDVSGKGVQASLFMSATHYLFRSAVVGSTLVHAASQINDSLCAGNEQCRFVTFWMGALDLGSGQLEYVNAGHDAPVILRSGDLCVLKDSENAPFGVLDNVEFVSGTVTLDPGDILFLFTDGVTEAMNADGLEFGKKNLYEHLRNSSDADTSHLIDDVLERVKKHTSGAVQSDDITMVCLKFLEKENKNRF